MGQMIGDVAAFALMAIAFVSVLAARVIANGARDRVRERHPDWYAALTKSGRQMRLGSDDEHVRRRLTLPLWRGRLPPGPAEDPDLRNLAAWFGLAMTATVASVAGLIAIVALRMAAGPA
jgi:hypothetical protein